MSRQAAAARRSDVHRRATSTRPGTPRTPRRSSARTCSRRRASCSATRRSRRSEPWPQIDALFDRSDGAQGLATCTSGVGVPPHGPRARRAHAAARARRSTTTRCEELLFEITTDEQQQHHHRDSWISTSPISTATRRAFAPTTSTSRPAWRRSSAPFRARCSRSTSSRRPRSCASWPSAARGLGARHRSDRLRQEHHARRHDQPHQPHARLPHPHHRRPDRVRARADARADHAPRGRPARVELRQRHSLGRPREPRRDPDRRAAHQRDDEARAAARELRRARVRHRAHQQRAGDHRAHHQRLSRPTSSRRSAACSPRAWSASSPSS